MSTPTGQADEGAPQQLHPDSTVDDLDQAESRLLWLGASEPDHQPNEAER